MYIYSKYAVRTISKENIRQVMGVYNSNQDFFVLTEGKPATLQGCIANIDAVPPGLDPQNKIHVSFWEGNICVAVLDFLKGYPESEYLYFGLLLVHKHWQGKGVGMNIIKTVLDAARCEGMNKSRIAVCDKNTAAIGFWSGLGFCKTDESTAIVGDTTMNVIIMEASCTL